MWERVDSRQCQFSIDYKPCAVAMNKYLYLLGGYSWPSYSYVSDEVRPTAKAGRFNAVNNSWERIADMNTPRSNACGIAAGGKIYIAGEIRSPYGRGVSVRSYDAVRTDTCEVYSISTNEWQLTASLNSPRSEGSMVCVKGTLYVLGGVHHHSSAGCQFSLGVEFYDFDKKKWKVKTKIPITKNLPAWDKTDVKAFKLYVSKGVLSSLMQPPSAGLLASFKSVFPRR